MAKNTNMIKAKKAKNDEFYTQLSDISAELTHQEYLDEFRGKWIYCNCDNPEISQFYTFFKLYFQQLGLKQLTCTYLAGTSGSKDPQAYRYDICGDWNGDGVIDDKDIQITKLQGNGSFDSPECLQILQNCDIVATNPPFSLFREYLDLLMSYNKKFVIIANMNSITYKETFKYIKNEQIFPGYEFNKTMEFSLDSSYTKYNRIDSNGIKYGKVPAIMWWTNIDLQKHHQPLLLCKEYYGNEKDYPRYDNYDAIECSKVVNIPKDYSGVIGVPITFLDKYCIDQFKILGMESSAGYDKNIVGIPVLLPGDARPAINSKTTYARLFIIIK